MNTQTMSQESICSWTPILAVQEVVTEICDGWSEYRPQITDAAMVQLVLDRHRHDVNTLAGQFVDCVNEILSIAS